MVNILEILFLIVLIIQVFYYLYFFSRFAFSSNISKKKSSIPVSVIICAKNEANNLKLFLPSIISQSYATFEIVLVNDHSTDDSLQVMLDFQKKTPNIQVVNLNNKTLGNKKNAVTQGINTAKYEHLLFTDADCEVKHNNWINEMAFHFSNEKQLILGYGAYEKINKSWLNKLIRFETLLTAIQYFSYAKANLTYMGVGRNIAYTKSLFTKANGFTKHQHIKSGDDDLFVNQMAVKNNVSLCYSENSFTYSKPHTNFKKWIYQKRRHISTANHYKLIHQFLLGLFYISQLLFWLLTFFLLFTSKNLMFIAVIIIIRLSLLYIIYGFSAKKLKETDLVLYLPFLELFLIVIQIRIFIQNIFSKPTNW